IEPNAGLENNRNRPPLPEGEGLTEVYLRFTLACNIEPNAGLENNRNRPPLPEGEGLTEVYLRFTLTCNIEPNAGLENNRNRLPLPRERAGVRGYGFKPCEQSPTPQTKNGPASAGPFSFGYL
ncbi:hypothetical protein, partial [Pseudomonas sp. 2957]|uniref:hypothetical protein n=1 Tax=Pseudomonas sp. 2957 TaxID=2817766 RepID=UPI00286C5440